MKILIRASVYDTNKLPQNFEAHFWDDVEQKYAHPVSVGLEQIFAITTVDIRRMIRQGRSVELTFGEPVTKVYQDGIDAR